MLRALDVDRRTAENAATSRIFSFPFAALALEMLGMAAPMVRGVVTGQWDQYAVGEDRSRAEILRRWDETTEQLESLWPQILPERFQETMTAFGMYEGRVYELLLYVIDNEIYHRGQGYVYLRALGIEPPPFYVRD